jgi:thiosulfate dehydrogenase
MYKYIFPILIVATMLLVINNTVKPEEEESLPLGYIIADVKHGALLYDNWLRVKKVEISSDHPLYPIEDRREPSATWRCKECHGWDYQGKNGRYGKDSIYKTGINGIYDARNMEPEDLFFAITNDSKNHDFGKFIRLSVYDIWSLVKFIGEGMIDINLAVNAEGMVNGDPEKGEILYGRYCFECHGTDGNKISFRESGEGIHGIGWEANADPEETLHKIRWGHPGSNMPSMIIDEGLSDRQTIDILSFCQTLYP